MRYDYDLQYELGEHGRRIVQRQIEGIIHHRNLAWQCSKLHYVALRMLCYSSGYMQLCNHVVAILHCNSACCSSSSNRPDIAYMFVGVLSFAGYVCWLIVPGAKLHLYMGSQRTFAGKCSGSWAASQIPFA
jgi:hypothetical protein